MNTKNLLLLLLAVMFNVTVKAQTLSRQVLSNYPASVSARVYDLVTKVPLTDDKQLQLAVLYQHEDSAVATALARNAAPSEVVGLRGQTNNAFQTLLTPTELDLFYTGNARQQAYQLAKAAAAADRAKLNGDSTMEKRVFNYYFNKYLDLNKIQQQYQYQADLNARLQRATARHDSICNQALSLYWWGAYFDNHIARLDSIKPLAKADKDKMRKAFSTLCQKPGEQNFADNFIQAMHGFIKDTAYYSALYAKEIRYRASNNANRLATSYTWEYQVSKDCQMKLYHVLFEKEKRLATIDYAFPLIIPQKERLQMQTTAYFDSLVNQLLYRDGVNTPNSKFFAAIHNKQYLELSQTQVDTLVNKGFELQKMKEQSKKQNNTAFDPKKFETDQLERILNEEQYNKFLVLTNRDNARKWAIKGWQEVKQYGIAQAADSTRIFKQIENYQLARCIAIDRYRDDKSRKYANLEAIDGSMPKALRDLRAAKRINKSAPADSTDTATKQYRGTFQW